MKLPFTILLLFVTGLALQAQRSGLVSGEIRDASNDEPLAFANLSIKGTSIGGVSDDEGVFTLASVPPGDQVLVISYVGYETLEQEIKISAGQTTDIGTISLSFESIMGEEVVVTALLRGQAGAINQQVESNTIMNVVSKDKIEEVPDVNAAESLSRLPGITISRSGGEGSQITVRGVSPRFNSVTMNGQAIPSTARGGRSSDLNGDPVSQVSGDRAVDLSMISSEMLDGIEVYKAITPDMDGDAVGGTVNLVTKTADAGGVKGRIHLETGYHSLINNIGTVKGNFNLGNRFLDNRLGVIVGANYSKTNRNVDIYEGDYELTGDGGYRGNVARFTNRIETRNRYGFNATVDYKFRTGKIVLDQIYSNTSRDITDRQMRARPTVSTVQMNFGHRENELSFNSTNLRGDFKLFNTLNLSFNLGRAKTVNETPLSYGTGASMESGLLPEANDAQPLDMMRYARLDVDEFYGGIGTGHSNNGVYDNNYTGQLDFTLPFTITSWFSGNVKFGGKFRQKDRNREVFSYGNPDGAAYELAFRSNFPDYERNGTVYPMSNFIDQDYTGYDSPFESHNDIPFVFDPDIVENHYNTMSGIDSLWRRHVGNFFEQYDALERITAGYMMAEINLGSRITLIPGFRYENTFLDYTGVSGTQRNNEPWRVTKTDTSATNTSGVFLPMVHLKWEFLDGFALRLAATKTLTRPNFLNLTPFTQIQYTNQREVTFGAIDLEIPTAWNYDVLVSWFSKFGLFSAGAFYKEIYDIDVNVNFFDYSGSRDTNPWYGWIVSSPINLDETTTVWGLEFEAQTNFRWLPKPFDGIVLSGNYSIINSETYYPFYYIEYPPPDYLPVTADSFRIESTQGQADFVANATLGYEKGGFSGNVSMNFQGPKFNRLGNSPFQDQYDDNYFRWDATLTYKFTKNWQVIMNLINFTNETQRQYIYTDAQPSQIEAYGWQINLAVRYWSR